MDNRQFNVNGERDDFDLFKAVIELAFKQDGVSKATGYQIDAKAGLVIFQYEEEGITEFPFGSDPHSVARHVWNWLESNPHAECEGWDRNNDHDGHNEIGWRVYCEGWGRVNDNYKAFIAVKPVYIWYGK